MSQASIPYSQELLRKTIHLASLVIPILYAFIDPFTMLEIMLAVTTLWVFCDVLRRKNKRLAALTAIVFGKMLREHESTRLSGASYMLLSACLCLVLLPKIVFITAFAILSVSDTAAALIGRRYGKHPYVDKTVEGTVAFMVSAMIVIMVIGLIIQAHIGFYIAGLFAAVISAHVELISNRIKIDDNFSIPLSVGAVMCIAQFMGATY